MKNKFTKTVIIRNCPILAAIFFFFMSGVNSVNAQCVHSVILTDTYGDGWTGGTIDVKVNGTVVLSNLTLGTGFGPLSYTFNASTGDSINVVCTNNGFWYSEMQIEVVGPGGIIIPIMQPPAGAGITGVGNCTAGVYCTASSVTPCQYMWITNVSSSGCTTNLNNSSTCSGSGYTDYSSSFTFSQAQNELVTMSFSTNNVYNQGFSVWVDWNNDLVFSVDEQMVSVYQSSTSANGSFLIPSGTAIGLHKVRVRSEYMAAPSDPCATLSFGETEDYSINVTAGIACSGAPTPGNTIANGLAASLSVCSGTTIALTLQNATTGSGVTYDWQSSSALMGPYTSTGITASSFSIAINSPTYYQCTVTCSGTTSISVPVLADLANCIDMTTGSSTSCNANFFDSGGSGNVYSSMENNTYTFYPNSGSVSQIVWNSFVSEINYDFITVYNGPNASSPVLYGPMSGTLTIPTLTSTDATGALTVVFTSDNTVNYGGWAASVSCVAPPPLVMHQCPVISCSGNQFAVAGPGQVTASVSYSSPMITGIPMPVVTYSLSGATTGSGYGNGSGSIFNRGTTTVHVIASNLCGSQICSFMVTVGDTIPPTITAPADLNVCFGTNVSLGTPITSDNDSVVSVTNDAPTVFPVGTTVVTWTVTDNSGNTASAVQQVTVSPVPTGSAANTVICNGDPCNLPLNGTLSGTNFTWTSAVTNGGVIGNSTCTIGCGTTLTDVLTNTGNVHGVVEYTITPVIGTCSGTPFIADVTVGAIPANPGAITGPTSTCGQTTATYSVAPVFGATSYIWTLPPGMTASGASNLNTITVNIAGTFVYGQLKVSAVNACGNIPGTGIWITGNAPTIPLTLSGPSNVCGLTSGTYSIPAVAGATGYNWTITGAGNSISGSNTGTTATAVLAGPGTISVAATNLCGSSPYRALTLVTTGVQPGTISGPLNTCGLTTATYSVAPVAYAATYTWSLAYGMTWISGQGTNVIDVNIAPGLTNNTATSPLKLTETNVCGNTSLFRSTTITRCLSPDALNSEGGNTFSNVYPNPTSAEFTMDVTVDKDQAIVLEVFDILGNVVISEKHNLTSGTSTMKTNMEQFNNGMYFVRILDANSNVMHTERVVKQ
jgi:PKD-like domain/GEVED domain/Secretion system C-terminal sorting domain/HYR domain